MTIAEFDKEIVHLRKTLEGFTYRFTFDADAAEDLVQETLLRALQYRDRYRKDTNLTGWLFTIMRNIYINEYRKAKRIQPAGDLNQELAVRTLADTHTFNSPVKRMEYEEVWVNLNGLPETLGLPLKMYLTGYKYEEIAAALDIPLGTVKNRIFNARKEIQHKLEGYR